MVGANRRISKDQNKDSSAIENILYEKVKEVENGSITVVVQDSIPIQINVSQNKRI